MGSPTSMDPMPESCPAGVHVAARDYEGWKYLKNCRSVDEGRVFPLCVARVRIPRYSTFVRPKDKDSRSGVSDDFRANCMVVHEMVAPNGTRCERGWSPVCTGYYDVDVMRVESNLDTNVSREYEPGLHFFRTRKEAEACINSR